jgi:hypothetical protein
MNTPPSDNLGTVDALRAQQVREVKGLKASPEVYSAFVGASGFLSGGTPRLPTKTQLLCRQPTYTRQQLLPSNFTPWLCRQPRAISEATTLPLLDLLAMLDADQSEGARFLAVCKASTRSKHVLTVLDLQAGRFYRAVHPTGILTYLKGIAGRRPAVKLLASSETYEP